jgi:hypothetical protein
MVGYGITTPSETATCLHRRGALRGLTRSVEAGQPGKHHLPIRPDTDWSEMAARFEAFAADPGGSHPKVRGAQLLKAGDTEATLIIVFGDQATMQDVSSTVAAPWLAENIRPYLSGPVARSAGEMIAELA